MMPAEQYHDFPLAPPDRTWDKNEAIPRLRRWASRDGSGDKEQMDWQKYRKVFFWHESGELNEFGQFKFPYCDIIDGEPHVVRNAVQNALARIENSDIPSDDKLAVRRVAERQMARFRDDDGESESKAFDNTTNTFERKFGEPTPAQLEKINRIAKRPLSKDEVFIYPHKMAGDMVIPERYIQLSIPLLKIFVQNANDGVAFLLDHSWAGFGRPKPALPYGRVFEGWLGKEWLMEGETVSFNGSVYIVRGQEKDGISTDSIISDIETGVLFDTSIGWGADKFECSICGEDIRNVFKCPHIPGKKYVIDEDTNEVKLCYAIAKPPGYLMEDSAVFDGAYPGAGASLSASGGDFENEYGIFTVFDDFKKIPPDVRIYGTYSSKGGILTFIKKADHKKVYAFSNNSQTFTKGGEKNMDEKVLKMLESFGITYKEGETKLEEVLSQLAEKWDATVKAIHDSAVPLKETECIITKAQKAEYDEYRKETIESAIVWGVRAMGNDFPAETWKKTFETMDKKTIEDIAKTWEAQAKDAIPAGRQTNPVAGLVQQNPVTIPDDAFKLK